MYNLMEKICKLIYFTRDAITTIPQRQRFLPTLKQEARDKFHTIFARCEYTLSVKQIRTVVDTNRYIYKEYILKGFATYYTLNLNTGRKNTLNGEFAKFHLLI